MIPKTGKEIESMRRSGQILKQVFDAVRPGIVDGTTTKSIAEAVAREIKALGGEAVLLGYQGFPDVVCISVNEQVVHGIPGSQIIKTGDLVTLDLCVGYEGMITDSAFTVVVGGEQEASKRVQVLLKAVEESLYIGIDQVKNGARTGDIGHAVEQRLRQDNLGVVESLVGHGVGHEVHENPEVPNYGQRGSGTLLKTGMTIAIEPMATLGSHEVVMGNDGWTISSRDGSLSAQFEHTVLVTEKGCEVLTA